MRIARTVLGAAGAGLAGFGAWTLLTTVTPVHLVALAVWLAAVVVVHDGILVPVLSFVRARWDRGGHARSVTLVAWIGFMAGGTITLFVAPELWAQARRPANPTILVGDYGVRLLAVWIVIALVVLVTARIARRRRRP